MCGGYADVFTLPTHMYGRGCLIFTWEYFLVFDSTSSKAYVDIKNNICLFRFVN